MLIVNLCNVITKICKSSEKIDRLSLKKSLRIYGGFDFMLFLNG